MGVALCIGFVVAMCISLVAIGRIIRLEKDLEWWRNECIRLDNEVGKWRSVACEYQQKAKKLIQEQSETIAGYRKVVFVKWTANVR